MSVLDALMRAENLKIGVALTIFFSATQNFRLLSVALRIRCGVGEI